MIVTAQNKDQLIKKLNQLSINFPVLIDVQEGEIRTIKQNARYWAAVVTATQNHIERETKVKWTREAIHNLFLVEKYGQKADTFHNKVYLRRARSSKMTTKQFAKFSEWAELYAIDELGVDPIEIDGLHGGDDGRC